MDLELTARTRSPNARPSRVRRFAKLLRRLGPTGPMAIIAAALPPVGAVVLLGLVTALGPALRAYAWAPGAVAVGFAVLGGVSILPTYAVSILAGWAFGFALGFPTAWAGIVGASLVGYAVSRRASGGRLVRVIDEKPSWRAVHGALVGGRFWHAVWVIVLLRVAPLPPFAVSNLVMGAAHVRLSRFLTGTAIGMAPQAMVLSLTAAGLHELSFRGAGEQPWMLAVGVVALLVVVVLVGRLARRALDSITAADADALVARDGPAADHSVDAAS
jgi:uncharacterized membrane protein YdjX (TVP38/TMEM64 family)